MRSLNTLVFIVSLAVALLSHRDVFAVAVPGPGGFAEADGSSTLELWLDANVGVFADDGFGGVGAAAVPTDPIRQWQDQSGNGNNADQTASANQAILTASVLNGNPALRFDGVDDRYLSLAHPNPLTMFVAYANRSNTTGSFYGTSSGANSPLQRNTSWWPDGSAGSAGFSGGASLNASNLATLRSDYTAGEFRFFLDGVQRGSISGARTHNSSAIFIGAGNNGGEPLNGDIAEMIIYNKVVSDAERIITENYLNSKYDIDNNGASPIGNDKYAGDLSANGDYDSGVFGIGAIDENASSTITLDEKVITASTGGLTITESGNTLDDATGAGGEFVLAGHDGTALAISTSDLPVDIVERWDRVWYLDTTGGVDVELTFDVASNPFNEPFNNYRLIRSVGQGPFSFVELAVDPTLAGGDATFLLDSASLTTGFYTLGIAEAPVPEPSSFLLLGLGALGLMRHTRRRRRRV